jgi:glycosyltransferase involved in cell wall biosynthesis
VTAQRTVVELTTVHPRDDVRILLKQAHTLARTGRYRVVLVVADGKGAASHEQGGVSVAVHDIGKPAGGRAGRAILGTWRAFRHVRRLAADVVHFHDPELIPAALALRCFGHRIVYDVHEDVPRQMLTKLWMPLLLRWPVARVVGAMEWLAAKLFDAVVPATPKIAERFPQRKTATVQNFPMLSEFVAGHRSSYAGRPRSFVYLGGISVLRGARNMVEALHHLGPDEGVRLELAGTFSPALLEDELRALPGWAAVTFHGYVSRAQVARLIDQARAGLVLLHPTENYPDAYPVKMFEYMAAGLPVIASDFPLWREIVQAAGCGLLVDPLDSAAIAASMCWMLDHPQEADEMGQRGRKAVEGKYNWEFESKKLLQLYDRLLGAAG